LMISVSSPNFLQKWMMVWVLSHFFDYFVIAVNRPAKKVQVAALVKAAVLDVTFRPSWL